MFSIIILLSPICTCLATPPVTEDQLRSLIQPLFDSTQDSKVPAKAPPLFTSLAAVSPLDPKALDLSQTEQVTQISPANQKLSQLTVPTGDIMDLIKTALGSLTPSKETAPPIAASTNLVLPGSFPNNFPTIFPNTFPSSVVPPPVQAPVPAKSYSHSFNPLNTLMSGIGGGSKGPFGMMNISMMIKMMEGLTELFL